MPGPIRVSMAVTGCGLDYQQLGGQLDRYNRLSGSVIALEQHAQRLDVAFSSAIDEQLLTQAIAVERGCCEFLTLDYDPSKRRLSITAEDTAAADALAAIRWALTPRPNLGELPPGAGGESPEFIHEQPTRP